MKFLDFIAGIFFSVIYFISFVVVFMWIFGVGSSSQCRQISHNERNLSPHEQQPEPIPAVTQGGFDVERWVL